MSIPGKGNPCLCCKFLGLDVAPKELLSRWGLPMDPLLGLRNAFSDSPPRDPFLAMVLDAHLHLWPVVVLEKVNIKPQTCILPVPRWKYLQIPVSIPSISKQHDNVTWGNWEIT